MPRQVRLQRYAAERLFASISDIKRSKPSAEVTFSGIMSKRKIGGGTYVSSFYQWITNVWTLDYGPCVLDLLPCYIRRTSMKSWGIRFDDLSAQCMLRSYSPVSIKKWYGSRTYNQIVQCPISFVPRVVRCETIVKDIQSVVECHLPAYRLQPDVVDVYTGSLLGKSAIVRRMILNAMGTYTREAYGRSILYKHYYVRADIYVCDMDPDSWGYAGVRTIMRHVERCFSSAKGRSVFCAFQVVVVDPYPGKSCTKASLVLYFKPSSRFDHDDLHHVSHYSTDRTVGRFSGAASSSSATY